MESFNHPFGKEACKRRLLEEYKKYDSPIDTYNLTIEGNNNYFVTDIQVLVHNAASPTS